MTIKNFSFALFLVVVLHCTVNSQNYFEGRIAYTLEFKLKNPNLNPDMLKAYLGSGLTLLFKEGNYFNRFDGGIYEFQMYNKEDNRSYMKKRDSDTIYWSDCSLPGDKIQELKITGKKATVLGIECDQILVRYKEKSEVHYYNADSTPINPAWFKRFRKDEQYLVDEKEKSIDLKSDIEYDQFTVIQTAIKMTREPVDDKIFKLPANAILVKQE